MAFHETLRTRQIQICSSFLGRLDNWPATSRLLTRLRQIPGVAQTLVGYRRPFETLAQAKDALGTAANDGHLSHDNIGIHLNLSEQPRTSDYAAFFYLAPHMPEIGRLFDAGGNVGNLYYYYTKYLQFRTGFEWLTMDLSAVVEVGRRIAEQRSAVGLKFTTNFGDAEDCDLLIACGSLHYFPESLPIMIGRLRARPRYVLVNRTPMTAGPDFATTQDAGTFRVACMVYNRTKFINHFENIGYRLAGQWDAPELSIRIPLHPEHSVKAYTGMFFVADQNALPTSDSR